MKVLLFALCLPSAQAFSTVPGRFRGGTSRSRLSPLKSEVASSSPDEFQRRNMEFSGLEPLPTNQVRRERMEKDQESRSQFVNFGDDLWDLRSEMQRLSSRLVEAINEGANFKEKWTRDELRKVERKDPELVYMLEKAAKRDAEAQNRHEDAAIHHERAMAARRCLPQFNLEGLWVGKYGSHGYELINVTYSGDMFIAEKVTGDRNVPRGEVTFQVELDPLHIFKTVTGGGKKSSVLDLLNEQTKLEPIKLTDKAAKRWGTSQLPRYSGLGQVAEEGFQNNQWMDGQLIIIGEEYFSFAWLPIEQQIFFGRPSPELVLKMLRDSGVAPLATTRTFEHPPALTEDMETLRSFITRCLEVTNEYEDDHFADISDAPALGCIWHGSSDECYFE